PAGSGCRQCRESIGREIMIGALLGKDIQAAARNRAFRLFLTGYLFLFSAAGLYFFFSFLSRETFSFTTAGEALFLQISVLQGVLIAGAAPWIILRMHAQDLGSMPFAGALTVSPRQLLSAKMAASAVYAVVMLSMGLPLFFLAKYMGAATLARIAWTFADTFLFLMVLILLIFHLSLGCRKWVVAWILSYAAAALLGFFWIRLRSGVSHESCTLILLLLSLAFGILLILHGDRTLVYEKD
ncbi:MAG: hypothetical protein JW793_00580, partial [Acidobacteria bacterium]|nr:hypothetical protein [Acidobacteriota bacterium]